MTSTSRKRGRPPRNGERATVRKEINLTLAEWRRVRGFMEAYDFTFAEAFRLTLMNEVATEEADLLPEINPATSDDEDERG